MYSVNSYEYLGRNNPKFLRCPHSLFIKWSLWLINIIRTIKSRRMGWARHVARMGEKRNAYRIFVESQKERDHWEDQDVGGWTILKWTLEK
jgi:hypothetical protein